MQKKCILSILLCTFFSICNFLVKAPVSKNINIEDLCQSIRVYHSFCLNSKSDNAKNWMEDEALL